MGEMKLGTGGYWREPSEVHAEGKEYDIDIVDLWDVIGEDSLGAAWRPACRWAGVTPLETTEGRDVGPEPLADGPLR